ncbi:MBL fold metallo-hydrolase [Sporichthya brevicatena]|uniref:MBL fold metallo-hydrolase n=1 Tax=Sporichthya brevicatena TaxID=171442 RepID=A0ABN1H569_9ACTN
MSAERLTDRLDRVEVAGFQLYVWYDPDGVTLIDTGPVGSTDAILDALARRGRDPGELTRIVLTHFHDDHVGSAAELRARTGAQVVAHVADAPVIRGEQAGPPPNFTDWERELHAQVAADLAAAPPVPVDLDVHDGDVLPFGGGARVLAVPGHTDGSIALHLPGQGVLFTGDVIAEHQGAVIPGVFNLDGERVLDAFRALAQLDVDVACFGHGRPVLGGAGSTLRLAAGT